ncbi:hypothetical protein MyNCGM70_01690 [Achromobacter xylosoxidans]
MLREGARKWPGGVSTRDALPERRPLQVRVKHFPDWRDRNVILRHIRKPASPCRAATAPPFSVLAPPAPAQTSAVSQRLTAPHFSPVFFPNFLYRRVQHHEEP